MTFKEWMAKVDRILNYNLGISYNDLPDIEYRLLFEDGTTAMEAVQIALKNAGYRA